MKAMIFAAGLGTRLRPLTLDTPKPLIPLRNRPLLDWIIRNLIHYNVSEIVINTHYLADKINFFLQKQHYPIPIHTLHEETILGTCGGIYNARNFFKKEPFFVCNADSLSTANFFDFFEFHSTSGNSISLAVNNRNARSMLLVDEDGSLVGIKREEKIRLYKQPSGKTCPVNFCGFHIITPDFFSYLKPPIPMSLVDCYLDLILSDLKIGTWNIGDSYWQSVETPENLKIVSKEFPGFTYASS